MKKLIKILILLGWSQNLVYGQISKSVSVEFGYNRVGLYVNPNFNLGLKNHILTLGLKKYGYNLFFENNPITFKIGYAYQFETKNEQLYFYPSVEISGTKENKTAGELWLGEIALGYGIGIKLSQKLYLTNKIGVGYILSKSTLKIVDDAHQDAYTNYEISIGLVYRFLGRD